MQQKVQKMLSVFVIIPFEPVVVISLSIAKTYVICSQRVPKQTQDLRSD